MTNGAMCRNIDDGASDEADEQGEHLTITPVLCGSAIRNNGVDCCSTRSRRAAFLRVHLLVLARARRAELKLRRYCGSIDDKRRDVSEHR